MLTFCAFGLAYLALMLADYPILGFLCMVPAIVAAAFAIRRKGDFVEFIAICIVLGVVYGLYLLAAKLIRMVW